MSSYLMRYSVLHELNALNAGRSRSMCGVIVVDAESFRSTWHRRDAYFHGHCLRYRHNFALFYQLLDSNCLPTVCFLSREKPLEKPMAPGLFWIIYFQIYKPKPPKIPCCNLFIFTLVCSFVYLLYLSLLDLTLVRDREGIDNPFFALCASVC